MDVEGEIDADEIGLLEGAEHGKPCAEAVLDHGVDGLGIGDAVGEHGDRLALQGVLQPVADEAGNIAAHMHRAAPGLA